MGSKTTTPASFSSVHTPRRRGVRSAAAVAIAALALTACSSGGGGGDEPEPEASYSQDQLVNALNSVEVDSQTLSAEAMNQESAGTQMDDIEQALEEATIEPAQCKDLVKAAGFILRTRGEHRGGHPVRREIRSECHAPGSADEAKEHAQNANQQNEDCQDFSMELMGSKIEATIEPRDIEIENGSEAAIMDMTMDMGGQSNEMTQASAVVANTFVVVSGQGTSGESESASAESPDIEAILQESVNKISEQ
ncbi:hypothetical protein [Kocuria atrinae]|uniref:hypothetical protein n=1 Tax=Kocuria atrinae TaxID=592377 RepID=UPI0002E54468|nr:hypothetical protein [Kocuria atrinae]